MASYRDDGILDPICGRRVVGGSQVIEYRKHRYVFCSRGCKERFERQIERRRLQDLVRLGALFAREKVRWGVA